jgi:hypothetical protein
MVFAPARHAGGPYFDDTDLGDAMLAGGTASGFEIDKDNRDIQGRFRQKRFRHERDTLDA